MYIMHTCKSHQKFGDSNEYKSSNNRDLGNHPYFFKMSVSPGSVLQQPTICLYYRHNISSQYNFHTGKAEPFIPKYIKQDCEAQLWGDPKQRSCSFHLRLFKGGVLPKSAFLADFSIFLRVFSGFV